MKRRKMLTQIRLTDQQRERLNAEIKAFYLDERGEEIGVIEQMQLLDMFEQKLAPIIYNRALDDAKKWVGERLEELESDYFTMYKDEDPR